MPFPKEAKITSTEIHGFSDASEVAYTGVVYLCMQDSDGNIHVSLVSAKTKVWTHQTSDHPKARALRSAITCLYPPLRPRSLSNLFS